MSSVLQIIMCALCFRCCTPTWTTTLSILTVHSTFHGHGSKPCTLKTDQCAVNVSHTANLHLEKMGFARAGHLNNSKVVIHGHPQLWPCAVVGHLNPRTNLLLAVICTCVCKLFTCFAPAVCYVQCCEVFINTV